MLHLYARRQIGDVNFYIKRIRLEGCLFESIVSNASHECLNDGFRKNDIVWPSEKIPNPVLKLREIGVGIIERDDVFIQPR